MTFLAADVSLAEYNIVSVLHQSPQTTVFRAFDTDGCPILIKTPTTGNPTWRQLGCYQWAFQLAREVDLRAVVPHRELLRPGASVALVMDGNGAISLAFYLSEKWLSLNRWLVLAIGLTTTVGHLHSCGVVHNRLNPHHVIVLPCGSELRLIALTHAIRLQRALTQPTTPQPDGMVAYMAPEQCGLVEGPIDQRSDLYSIGVILFEMATGRFRFTGATSIEHAHARVAGAPLALNSLRQDFPASVSDIVARLLAKNADERYGSTQGLAHDLNRCLTQLHRQGAVRPFPLGEADRNSRFRVSSRLYRRKAEQVQLLEALEMASDGKRVFLAISGASGIGKTTLVTDGWRRVDPSRFRVCSGKFDEFGAEDPYLGLLKAFRSLLRHELAQPPERLASRAVELQKALGVNGQLLTAALPDLELIVGPQPNVEDVSPRDGARRLHLLVGRFLSVFASRDQPLLMFLDDLQWADSPSVELIEALAVDPALDHLVLVAGYRSNEVGPGHPLHLALDRIRKPPLQAVDIKLVPLSKDDVQQILVDTLHVESTQLRDLATHVHELAAGNPFFVSEFLYALHERGFFHYDEHHRSWTWVLSRINQFALPDNVSGLIADRLEGLPTECLDMLDTASCIGSEFDLQTLASVHDLAHNVIAVALAPAVRSGIIVPLDQQVELFESLDGWFLSEQDISELGTACYRFQHDRVRQTVHERLDGERRAQRHLRIGRLLLHKLTPADLDRRVVEVFMHVVEGAHLFPEGIERNRTAEVGLAAGQRAQRGLAFESALQMLDIAAGMLGPSAWTDNYSLAYGIHLARAQCAYALMRLEVFTDAVEVVITHSRNVADCAVGHGLRIRMLHSQTRFAEAVDIGTKVATSLGVALPAGQQCHR